MKESFVAFIDVLGFSQMILEDGGSGKKLAIIKDSINEATGQLRARQRMPDHEFAYWYKEFKVKSFSDCFCFSIPLEFDNGEKDYKQNFVSFYVWIEAFRNTMLKNGFLCRGGITQDWHYYDDEIIFSKALVDAYYLESKTAIHPMIQLHENLIKKLIESGMPEQPYYKYMFVHDTTGKSFFHQFNYSVVDEIFFKPSGKINKHVNERNQLLNMFIPIIDDNIKKLIGNNAVDKWHWLKDFLIYTLKGSYSERFYPGFYLR